MGLQRHAPWPGMCVCVCVCVCILGYLLLFGVCQPTPPPSPNSCTMAGLPGTCIADASCAKPQSTVGNYCLSDPVGVNCCITPRACTNTATGQGGVCIESGKCGSWGSGYTTAAGYCPNDPVGVACCSAPVVVGKKPVSSAFVNVACLKRVIIYYCRNDLVVVACFLPLFVV